MAVANRLKWLVVADLKREIDQARDGTGVDPLEQEAMALREALRSARDDAEAEMINYAIAERTDQLLGRPVNRPGEGARDEEIYNEARELQASRFTTLARGTATPIKLGWDTYQDEQTTKARTKADDARIVDQLMQWCREKEVPATLEAMDKKTVIRFRDGLKDMFPEAGPDRLNKYLGRLARYWEWLAQRGEVESNVWRGIKYKVPTKAPDETRRPFKDEEMVKLFSGPATQQMHDLMRIGALTGARIDAIVSLRVKDVIWQSADGGPVLVFKPQKKETKERLCPVHPDLVPILERRAIGREPDDILFPEWPPVMRDGSMREQSFKASNHFTTYRRSVGVDDTKPGQRNSTVVFHSFRHWFTTKAEQAGQPEGTIAAVVGHKRPGMTLGRYSAGPSIRQARECVEAVQLPLVVEDEKNAPGT